MVNARLSSFAILFLLAALMAPAIAAGAASPGLTVSVQTFKTSFMIELYHENSVAIPANGSITVDVNIPSYLNASDVAAIHIIAENVSGEIQLAAYAGNDTVASGTIVPLSSTYHTTLPPNTTKIVLSSRAAANATITVYLQTTDAEFKLTLERHAVLVERGGTARVNLTLEQVSGPELYVWATEQADYPLIAQTYYMSGSLALPWDSQHAVVMSPGFKRAGYVQIDWPEDGVAKNSTATVKVYFWADLNGVNPESAQLVAVVDLSGSISDTIAHLTTNENSKYISFGIGAIAAFLFAMLIFGKKGGRRGTANGMAPVILILIALAAIGLTAGLIDFNPHVDIDAKYLGIGILAILALIMLIRQGAVPAPRSVRKLFK